MSRPIDYSKWDRVGEDDSDSDDEEQEQERRGPPRITKFDAPMSVTIGGGDSGTGKMPAAAAPPPTSVSAAMPPPARRPSTTTAASSSSSKVEDVAENGAELEAYSWRQGRQEAVLTVWCPPDTRAKDVSVAYDKESRHLRVTAAGAVLLEGKLANPVTVDEDTGLEWELVGGGSGAAGKQRAVRITLPKETPRSDMVHWWSRVLDGEREIDTTKIQGRNHTFSQAWEEAQAMFQESVRKRAEQGPVEIP